MNIIGNIFTNMNDHALELIIESIILEYSRDQEIRRLGSTVSNFLQTKHGSGLEGMDSNTFSKILSTAIGDIMTSKKVTDSEMPRQIARFVTMDLIQSGLRPHPNKKKPAQAPQAQKKPAKQGMFSRLFGR